MSTRSRSSGRITWSGFYPACLPREETVEPEEDGGGGGGEKQQQAGRRRGR